MSPERANREAQRMGAALQHLSRAIDALRGSDDFYADFFRHSLELTQEPMRDRFNAEREAARA